MTDRQSGPFDWKALLGILISVGLLWFALRGVDPARVLAELRRADPAPFLAAVFLATFLFVIRAWRWRPLLRPVLRRSAFRPRFAATSIGFMANNLLPARAGEFVRAYVYARLEPVPMTASFGSIVVERLLDGLTVVGFLILALTLPSFPRVATIAGRDVDAIAAVALGVFIVAGVVLLAMVLRPRRAVALAEAVARRVLPSTFRRPVVDALEAFLDGIGALRSPALLARAVLWSLVLWLVGAVSFWLAFQAFDLAVPFAGALFLQSLIGLAVSIPAAPGFFGVYEAAVRVGLVNVWGVALDSALALAIGFHIGGFIPVTLIGLYYVWRLGLSWDELEHSEEAVEEAVEARPGAERRREATSGRGGAA